MPKPIMETTPTLVTVHTLGVVETYDTVIPTFDEALNVKFAASSGRSAGVAKTIYCPAGVSVAVGVLVGVAVLVGVFVAVAVNVAVAVLVGVAVGSRLVMVWTTPSSLNEPSQVGSAKSQFVDAPSSPGAPNWNMAYSPASVMRSYA